MDASSGEAWDRGSLSIWHSDIGIRNNIQESQASSNFEELNSACLSSCQSDVRPLIENRWRPRAFCRVFTGDSVILSSCDMNDEPALRLCREIWPSFESGHLGVHFTWSWKHRVPLTYILLRENSTWGASRKLAYHFSRRQGISSHIQTIWSARIFHPGDLLKLMFL